MQRNTTSRNTPSRFRDEKGRGPLTSNVHPNNNASMTKALANSDGTTNKGAMFHCGSSSEIGAMGLAPVSQRKPTNLTLNARDAPTAQAQYPRHHPLPTAFERQLLPDLTPTRTIGRSHKMPRPVRLPRWGQNMNGTTPLCMYLQAATKDKYRRCKSAVMRAAYRP